MKTSKPSKRKPRQVLAGLAVMVLAGGVLAGAASAAPVKDLADSSSAVWPATVGEHLVALAATPQGSSAQSGSHRRRNGRIAYTVYLDEIPEIFTIKPSGRETRRLTHNDTYDNSPAWSPDGRKIAFGRWDGNDNELWIMRGDGSHKRQLTNDTAPETALSVRPSWSPSGEVIAFGCYDGNDFELCTIKPDGTGRHQLTHNAVDDNHVDWSPTGGRIAYDSFDGTDQEIYTITPDGHGVRQVTHNATDDLQPSYSPSGRRLTYAGGDATGHDQIFTHRVGSPHRHQITHNPLPKSEPSWSPNGRRIAYLEDDHASRTDVYTIKFTGGGKHRVTRTEANEDEPDWGARPIR